MRDAQLQNERFDVLETSDALSRAPPEPFMKPRISMITLGVRDLARSVEFYQDGLGFPRMKSPPNVAFFTPERHLARPLRSRGAREGCCRSRRGSWLLRLRARGQRRVEDRRRCHLSARAAGRSDAQDATAEDHVGRLQRLLRGSRRAPVGGRPQPALLGRPKRRVSAPTAMARPRSRSPNTGRIPLCTACPRG